ncbi:hypothetical protein [Daejeonella lutea]|nr:hypothetical protein [Daejeonella lutea]
MNIRLPGIMNSLRAMAIFVILLISLNSALAQQNFTQVKAAFERYQSGAYYEKVFIHTDREFYLAGELMWFKSYNTDAATNRPSVLSKVTYLELFDANKKSVLQTKIPINGGSGNGSVFLPLSLQSGNYVLRAYTSWMMNFGPDLFFEKKITILNSLSPGGVEPVSALSYDVQFFPEGGNLLANVENKVAFRVTNSGGFGESFRGAVIDERNDTVARFQPLKFGIGNFSFMPAANKKYRAIVYVKGNSQTVSAELPTVRTSGYNLKVITAGPGQVNVKVNSVQNSGPVYLFIHNRQQTKVAEVGVIENGTASFNVDIAKLDEGISHFTIFNSDLRPVAERLYFKRPKRQLAIQATTDKRDYSQRNKVNIGVEAQLNNRPAEADMSVAIYKLDSLSSASGTDFFNYQWLSSELKGNVEQADYYFRESGSEIDQALDNLMLTHGWRRFQWTDVLKGQEPVINHIPEFDGHIITGTIKDRNTGRPASGIMTFLSIPSKRTQIYSSRSDENGKIRFFTKGLQGPGEAVVQTNLMQDSSYVIEISNPFSEALPQTLAGVFKVPGVSYSLLQDHHVNTQVQNVYFANKLRSFKASSVDSTSFYGQPEFIYNLDDFVRFKTTEEVLREYVPAVVIFRQRNNFNVVVDKKTASGPVGSVPLIILDGVPIFDRGNKIMAYDPAKIQRLEVSTKNSFLGDTTFNSIVNFTSFKGNLEGFELDPRDLVIDYEGLQLQREFFSPLYETEVERSSRLPDMRQLLYWSPNVRTDKNGKSSVSFYTSDQSGKYVVVIQGITADGKPGSAAATFEVNNSQGN